MDYKYIEQLLERYWNGETTVEEEDILRDARELLTDTAAYERMARAVNPYGDGQACRRIAEAILYANGLSDRRPDEFST